ncbi:MAG TPA: hypothetical protein VER55_09785 [Ardenticatenaceae bacterium]|nr:hypothetical protein [Ardenticatenaceae bacterium]
MSSRCESNQTPTDSPQADRYDLFRPSVQEARSLPTGAPPWRLQSQFFIAFFGGVLGITAIAYLNSRRLGLPKNRLRQILVIGLIAFIGVIALEYVNAVEGLPGGFRLRQSFLRVPGRIVAVVVCLVFNHFQSAADDLYQSQYGDAYSSMWKAGMIAIFGLGTLQSLAIYGIVSVLSSR